LLAPSYGNRHQWMLGSFPLAETSSGYVIRSPTSPAPIASSSSVEISST
jgi:hypothetical protein